MAPLLRLENNHCHIEESEHVLKKAHKYSELIILYEKKGLHEKGRCEVGVGRGEGVVEGIPNSPADPKMWTLHISRHPKTQL